MKNEKHSSRDAETAQGVLHRRNSGDAHFRMSDPYTDLRQGDRGTVTMVDDIGTVHVNWDRGSTLGVVFGERRVLED